jgi:hypothetical protein
MSQAKSTASSPTDDRIRRKLWLRLALHVIHSQKDVRGALDLLRESTGDLKIEGKHVSSEC